MGEFIFCHCLTTLVYCATLLMTKAIVMTTKITFTVDRQKIYNAILYIMAHGERHPYNIMKILSKADIIHLNGYGRPVAGDVLLVETHGTTPKHAKDIVMATWGIGEDFFNNNEVLEAKGEPDYDMLSGTDMIALNDAIAIYKDKSPQEVETLNHSEPFWSDVKDKGLDVVPAEALLDGGENNQFYNYLASFGPSIVF